MDLIIKSPALKNITLELKRSRTTVDTVDFSFDKNLDTLLIVSIDKFLKRNRIDILSLKSVRIDENIDKVSSLYKIVKAYQAAVNSIRKASKS